MVEIKNLIEGILELKRELVSSSYIQITWQMVPTGKEIKSLIEI